MLAPPDPSASRNIQTLLEFNERLLERECPSRLARPVERLGLVGAGFMGRFIASRAVANGLSVVVQDVHPAPLQHLRSIVEKACPAGARVRTAAEPSALAECDLVIESIPENPALKREVYQRIEPHLRDGVPLGTNTSTLPIARLAAGLADPSRFCGIHFFPMLDWSLVEIIRGPATSAATLAAALGCVRALGLLPMLAPDGPGFVVNRLMLLYVNEAMQLLMEGASIEAVDQAAETFGMALGPLRLVDEVGLDTTLDCAWSFCGAFPDVVPTSPLLVSLVKAKRLGRKSLGGFYRYESADGPPAASDPVAREHIARWAAPPRHFDREIITRRLFLAMILEAARMLQSGVVRDPRLIDLGLMRGLGFPESRGGLLYGADAAGPSALLEALGPLQSLGRRFQPEPLLTALARDGGKFYDLSMF